MALDYSINSAKPYAIIVIIIIFCFTLGINPEGLKNLSFIL